MFGTLALDSTAQATTIQAPEGDTTSKSCAAKIDGQEVKLPAKTETPKIAKIKKRIADVSQKYGLDYDQLNAVIQCESSLRTDQYGDSMKAFGIAQFHKETFDLFCNGDYYNYEAQLDCMGKMFSQGLANHWSCFKKLYKEVIFNDPLGNQIVLK